jgi:hypothetical protein
MRTAIKTAPVHKIRLAFKGFPYFSDSGTGIADDRRATEPFAARIDEYIRALGAGARFPLV